MSFYNVLYIGIGGFIGSIARYLTIRTVDARFQSQFPFGTLTVNIIGSLIIGLVYGIALKKGGLHNSWVLFLGTGICGGYTTFSAFALENFTMLQQRPAFSIAYILLSIVVGLLAVATGFFIGKAVS